MQNPSHYFQVINVHKNIFKKADQALKESYAEHKYDNNFEFNNNYQSIIFSSNKPADEIDFIIFYTLHEALREKNYYVNTEAIEAYFLTTYNIHFFDSIKTSSLFSRSFNVSKDDFKKILQPNLIFLLHREVDITKQKNNPAHQLVTLNFDFLLCGMESPLLLYYATILGTKPNIVFDNAFSLAVFTMKLLFATACIAPDTNLEGLFFEDEHQFNRLYNDTVRKYFTIDNSFNWGKQKILPADGDFVNLYKTVIQDKDILIHDFEQIQLLFQSNLPLIAVK